MNTRRLLLIFIIAGVLLSGVTFLSVAQADQDVPLIVPIPISGGGSLDKIPNNPATYVKIIYQWAIGLAALIAMAQLVLGGVQYVISAGMPSAKNSAEERMTSAVTGLVILLSIVIILTTINPALLNIQLPALGNVRLRANALSDDDLIKVSHERTTTATVADLKVGSVDDATANAAIAAAKGGKTEADDYAAAVAARDAGVGDHGTTQAEARKSPYYRAMEELDTVAGRDVCGDDLQDLKVEIDEYVDDPDMSEVIGPDGVFNGDNGDFAEPLEEGYKAEQDAKAERDYEKALAQATVRCKRAAILLGVRYAREVFDQMDGGTTFKKFTNQMRKLPSKYNVDVYFDPKSEKLFGGF